MFDWVLNTPLCSKYKNDHSHKIICQTNLIQKKNQTDRIRLI